MSFQILDKAEQAIVLKDLDFSAASLWNKEVSKKHWANPSKPKQPFNNPNNFPEDSEDYIRASAKHDWDYIKSEQVSWYDSIGFWISSCKHQNVTWENVLKSFLDEKYLTLCDCSDNEVKLLPNEFGAPTHIDDFTDELFLSIPEEKRTECVQYSYFAPYVQLVELWASKGYTPLQLS